MFAKGIQLTLLIGPVVPVPVPRAVLEALESVEVRSSADRPSGFQLKFAITARSLLNTLFLIGGASNATPFTPALRVLLILTLNGQPQPLFDGVMTNMQVQPASPGQAGSLVVTGEDLTRMMDRQDWSGLPFPAVPVEGRVALLCAKYGPFGLMPLIVPVLFAEAPNPVDRIPTQQGTDLAYIQELARQVGYVFYLEPGPTPGTNIAYFGPEIKIGVPQPALNVDMDARTNVESLSLNFDADKGVLPLVFIQNPLTRAPIPIPLPAVNPLQPPLGALPAPLSNIRPLKDSAKMSPMRALSAGLAEAAKSQDAVSGNGTLDVLRYGRPLKARGLVGVRGTGVAFDGLYYVSSVTSTLKRGEFKQSFELTRNGLISLLPVVPV